MTHAATLAPPLVGLLVLAAGTLLGWDPALVEAIVRPPPIIRAALVGGSIVLGFALLAAAVRRLEGTRSAGSRQFGSAELAAMVRGVRLVFLAVAAFSAGAGWAIAHPLPIVVALVIAGVDVIETSFLMLVVTLRRQD